MVKKNMIEEMDEIENEFINEKCYILDDANMEFVCVDTVAKELLVKKIDKMLSSNCESGGVGIHVERESFEGGVAHNIRLIRDMNNEDIVDMIASDIGLE